MDIESFNKERQELNSKLVEADQFFEQFANLDTEVYSDSVIPKKYKELTGLSISILSRCNECILYHLQGCIDSGANKIEIVEAIKIGVVGGGSITYPSARFAIKAMTNLNIG